VIYARYYGWRLAALLVAVMFAAMVVAALAVDGIFSWAGLVPEHRPSIDSITNRGISWDYTTALNIVFTLVALTLLWLTTAAPAGRAGPAATAAHAEH
jgi:hypothetical protein